MRQEQLKARPRKRFKCPTMSDHDQPVAANVLDRQLEAAAPDQKWVGDTTELLTGNGKRFLAVMDSLGVFVGWGSAWLGSGVASLEHGRSSGGSRRRSGEGERGSGSIDLLAEGDVPDPERERPFPLGVTAPFQDGAFGLRDCTSPGYGMPATEPPKRSSTSERPSGG